MHQLRLAMLQYALDNEARLPPSPHNMKAALSPYLAGLWLDEKGREALWLDAQNHLPIRFNKTVAGCELKRVADSREIVLAYSEPIQYLSGNYRIFLFGDGYTRSRPADELLPILKESRRCLSESTAGKRYVATTKPIPAPDPTDLTNDPL